jgi:hypothetical protein
MKITSENFQAMREWFEFVTDRILPPGNLPREMHPVVVLDETFKLSPSRARQGLAMAIGDLFEATQDWTLDQVAALDEKLRIEGLATLSEMKARFLGTVQKIIERGKIRSEREYYAIRNIVEGVEDQQVQHLMWDLLSDFEQSQA